MTDSSPGRDSGDDRDGEATPQAGVLGNLPRSRPSVRSPRRPEAPDPVADAASAAATTRPEADERKRDEADPAADPAPAGQGPDIEALARGGIAVATGAATLGLRIAGRAAAAVRDAVERR